jgi:hypothetical protein
MFKLRFNVFKGATLEASTFAYDAFADTMVFGFTSDPRPTVGVALGDFMVLRVDPTSEEVVGMEVEHFVKAAVYQYPVLFAALQWVDNPPKEMTIIRRRFKQQNLGIPEGNAAATKRGLMDALGALFDADNHQPNRFLPANS